MLYMLFLIGSLKLALLPRVLLVPVWLSLISSYLGSFALSSIVTLLPSYLLLSSGYAPSDDSGTDGGFNRVAASNLANKLVPPLS